MLGSGIAGERKGVAPLRLTRGPRAWRPAVLYQLLPQRLPRQLPPWQFPGRRLKAHAKSGALGRRTQAGIHYARGEIVKDVLNVMVSLYLALAFIHIHGHLLSDLFSTSHLSVSSATTHITLIREVYGYGPRPHRDCWCGTRPIIMCIGHTNLVLIY